MEIIWKSVAGYEGLYNVSNTGLVMRLDTLWAGKGGLRKPTDNGKGYKIISLSKPGNKKKNKYIHRLVAESFLPNPLNKVEVNHIDGNKANNTLSNLEWCSISENQLHSYRIGLKVSNPENIKKMKSAAVAALSKKVKNIDTGEIFTSITSASASVGQHRMAFRRRIARGVENRFVLLVDEVNDTRVVVIDQI